MDSGFDFDVIQRSWGYLFREGMTFTVTLTLLAMSGGIIFGTLLAMMRLSAFKPLSWLAGAYVNLMRSVPLVLVIFWFFFLVPYIGAWILREPNPIKVGAWMSAVISFTMFEAAYCAEIMRAGIQLLPDCFTEVAKGEVVVVCGPSGSGKSTIIKCVNALEPFQKGSITVEGISVGDPKTNLPKLRSRIGMVFQNFELFPHMTVTENLTLGQVKVLGRSIGEATEKGLKLLERVGLLAHKDKYPGQLSGGQQQRVAIARALSMDPIAMLFDEPTSALDPEMINEVLDVMGEPAKEGMTMMVVTHEMGFARKVAHRVIFMDAGRIVEDANKEEFFGTPRSERAQQFLSKILHH